MLFILYRTKWITKKFNIENIEYRKSAYVCTPQIQVSHPDHLVILEWWNQKCWSYSIVLKIFFHKSITNVQPKFKTISVQNSYAFSVKEIHKKKINWVNRKNLFYKFMTGIYLRCPRKALRRVLWRASPTHSSGRGRKKGAPAPSCWGSGQQQRVARTGLCQDILIGEKEYQVVKCIFLKRIYIATNKWHLLVFKLIFYHWKW